MKMKRFLSGVMACVMTTALMVPAFALDVGGTTGGETGGTTTPDKTTTNADGEATLKLGGTTNVPVITVKMPTSTTVVLNPYRLGVNVGAKKDVNTQVASATMAVTNLSEVDLKIELSVTGTSTLLTNSYITDVNAYDTTKKVYMYAMAEVADKATDAMTLAEVDSTTESDVSSGTKLGYGLLATSGTAAEVKGFGENDDASRVDDSTHCRNVLAAAKSSTSPAKEDGVLLFKFGGQATANPKDKWTTSDKVDLNVAFKFVPVAAEVAP